MNAIDLIRELWKESAPAGRCPFVRFNGKRCRCGAVDEQAAELVCDTASLQLWCLDAERYRQCHFYPRQERPGK